MVEIRFDALVVELVQKFHSERPRILALDWRLLLGDHAKPMTIGKCWTRASSAVKALYELYWEVLKKAFPAEGTARHESGLRCLV